MGSKWVSIRLGDVCAKIGSGATPRGGSSVYLDSAEVALIRSQNVYNDGFRRDGLAFITAEHAKELEQVEVMPGDVLLNITGDSVARCCQVDESILPARVNQHVAIVRPNPQKLDPRFLRYFLVSPQTQARMLSWAGSGGTRNALTKGMIESFAITAPSDVDEQRAISHILDTLDDKIELNRRMNETLEAIARAIFKSWFVDFDPVQAKAEGRQPSGMDAATAALFPDSFQDSPLGKIPKGWRVSKIAEVASLSRESVSPSAFPDEVFHHYSIPAFDEGRWPKLEAGAEIKSNKFLVPPDSVLISKLNPRFARVWLPAISHSERSIASTEFLVALARKPFSREYLHGLFTSESFFDVFATLVTGTSGSHQRVRPEFLGEMDAVIPPLEAVTSFSRAAGPLYTKVAANLGESRSLAAIRDALLPKLISGEVRVPFHQPKEVARP